ncbi:hypothetical protein V7D15_07510 [Thermoanaerobacter thermohydrosulfuricus]
MKRKALLLIVLFISFTFLFPLIGLADTSNSNKNDATLNNIEKQLKSSVPDDVKNTSFSDFLDRTLNKAFDIFNAFKKLIILILVGNGLYGALQWATAGSNPIPKKEGLHRIIFSIIGYFVVTYAGLIYTWITNI